MNTKDEKKITNEKPVSLFPLDFKEAVAAFLKVKPKPKEKKKPQKKTRNKKRSTTAVLMSPKDITDKSLDRALDALLGKE